MGEQRNCLNCRHHVFDHGGKAVFCNHPQRPNVPVKVDRWFAGCDQHAKKEDTK